MPSAYDQEEAQLLEYLEGGDEEGKRIGRREELRTTPLMSLAVRHEANKSSIFFPTFPQYGLLGFNVGNHADIPPKQPIFLNVDAPNSVFICGSQGSGKSYTLSCILESCLLSDTTTGKLAQPVAGVVFHYDIDSASSVAEAANLCSRGVKVRVLVSKSNEKKLTQAYSALQGANENLVVVPLLFSDKHLSIERMHKLMAFSEQAEHIPLYMEVIQRLLRTMAVSDVDFTFSAFMNKLENEAFAPGQRPTMNMRLDLLKSFLHPSVLGKKAKLGPRNAANLFDAEPGTLTVVDLSDPFVDAATSCVLFDICLSLFKENRPASGLVVALDEAHKFLDKTAAAANFTERLLTTIREQRHNATRVIIATQEPTLSEKLLDLCSVSIVHHFKSPAWFTAIRGHLGGAASLGAQPSMKEEMFERIIQLEVGESLVFAPLAFVGTGEDRAPQKLGSGVMKMKTRARKGVDGGSSVLASLGAPRRDFVFGSGS